MYAGMTWRELRMSVQWKAYCFRDEAERQLWLDHTDDLVPETAFQTMIDELRRRGIAIGGLDDTPEERGRKIVTAFVGCPLELQQVHEGEHSGGGSGGGGGSGSGSRARARL
jgi:hypothetical protein